MVFNIKKPRCCSWICDGSWESLTMKEKDFIIFLYSKKYSKDQIMRKLHIEDRTSYWRLQTRVKKKIKDDVAKFNEYLSKTLQNATNG
jgi:hypothetical protein